MYDTNFYKCDVTALDPLPCHKLSHLLGPSTTSSVTYFMDGPYLVPLHGHPMYDISGLLCPHIAPWFDDVKTCHS